MTDEELLWLCNRVINLPPKFSFTEACQFLADCTDLDFFHIVKVCQPLQSNERVNANESTD